MSLSTVGKQVKYGLMPKKAPAAAVPMKQRLSVFDREDSDEDDGPSAASDVSRVNAQLSRRNAVLEQSMAAAATDDIYDYDGAYDSFKAKEVTTHKLSQAASTREAPKARYVNNLLSTAKMREKEKERVFEKNLLKERKEEDKEFGDKDKFVTAAYKKKLLDDKKWEYEDRLADEVEQRTDVRKSGMEGFYANLLTKNVAMGGDVDTHAISAYTAGSNRQTHVLSEPQAEAKKSLKFNHSASSSGTSTSSGAVVATNQSGNSDGESDHGELTTESSRYVDKSHARDMAGSASAVVDQSPPRTTPLLPITSLAARSNNLSETSEKPAVVGAEMVPTPVLDKTDVIMSAKDRYLARKRALEN